MTPSHPLDFPFGKIGYAEKPFRRDPEDVAPDSDIYQASQEDRTQVLRTALEAGIGFFHAAYEREAASLGASLRTLDIRSRISLSTTDGDVLDRCPDTADGAAQAIRAAIARKRELLGASRIDAFSLYDIRRDVHTGPRINGARRALEEAQQTGEVGSVGATCYEDYDVLAELIETETLPLDFVLIRYNYADQRAAGRLLPTCRDHGVKALATQTFSWYEGIPFVRFPNTWRYRNLTKNFFGITAAQAHLSWVLRRDLIDGALISMQTPAQIAENVEATQTKKEPAGLESLFDSFVEAITTTREGWRGLLQDEQWEYRAAAEGFLNRRKR